MEHGHLIGDHPDELHVVLDHDHGRGLVDLLDQFGGAGPRHGSCRRSARRAARARAPPPPPCRARPIDAGRAPVRRRCRRGCRQAEALERLGGERTGARTGSCQRRAASQMFSSTVLRPSNTFGTWVLMPTPRRATSCGWRPPAWKSRITMSPSVGVELAGEALEERALARAVGADQAAQLVVPEREVDPVDGDDAAEMHATDCGSRGRSHRS